MLACPHCTAPLAATSSGAACPSGHTFDQARQGYLSLLQPGALVGTGDDADMVAARSRFFGGGHYAPLRTLLADLVAATALPPPNALKSNVTPPMSALLSPAAVLVHVAVTVFAASDAGSVCVKAK